MINLTNKTSITLNPIPPYNFDLVGNLYSRFSTQCVDYYSNGEYKRTLKVGENIHLVKVRSTGSLDKPVLLAEILPRTNRKKYMEEKIRWILGIDNNLKEFYKMGLKDKKFAKIIKRLYGLRAPKTPTVFEALIIAITEQQIALPVAILMRKGLVEKYGEEIEIDDKIYHTFPSPKALAKARPEEIKKLKFSLKKSEYMVDISQRVFCGEIELEKMKRWNKEKILDTLTQIRGIGPWTVEYMMCRGMGRYDVLPANDLGLRAALTKYLNKKERVSEKEVREFLESFGKYKGYAAFYLIYNYAFQKYPQEKLFK
jgi:DNA-3-methyladenine glycosylase II